MATGSAEYALVGLSLNTEMAEPYAVLIYGLIHEMF
jgi:hypothetical protein